MPLIISTTIIAVCSSYVDGNRRKGMKAAAAKVCPGFLRTIKKSLLKTPCACCRGKKNRSEPYNESVLKVAVWISRHVSNTIVRDERKAKDPGERGGNDLPISRSHYTSLGRKKSGSLPTLDNHSHIISESRQERGGIF